jgi:hypothetical protein
MASGPARRATSNAAASAVVGTALAVAIGYGTYKLHEEWLMPPRQFNIPRVAPIYNPSNPADEAMWRRCSDLGRTRDNQLLGVEWASQVLPLTAFDRVQRFVQRPTWAEVCATLERDGRIAARGDRLPD